ncbi:MAG: FAD-dependent oxidoreductase [Alphaproteobacteria bacterium]|jgi:thioredoxin reductase (NADPH)|nr:FAD-dependent oxidoreductase [Alphaproteobacteria bacterium]
MEIKKREEIVIVGSGIAGLTAGIYTSRAGYEPLIISGNSRGGQTAETHDIENYPGFKDAISGFELMGNTEAQAVKYGSRMLSGEVVDFDLSDEDNKKVILRDGTEIVADSIIFATGASPRKTGLQSELDFAGRGVSYCAVCDGNFYRGKKVAVLGGGNSAVGEALYLSNIASEVYLIHRGEEFNRAEKVFVDQLYETKNIKIIKNSGIKEVLGDAMGVNAVVVGHEDSNDAEKIEVDGLFVAIGKVPNTSSLEGKVDLKPGGYVKTEGQSTETNVEGFFVAGDIASPFQQIVIAAGQAAVAAIECQEYLSKKGVAPVKESTGAY